MYVSPYLAYAGATAVAGILSRLWYNFRKDFVARKSMRVPLFPAQSIESVLAAKLTDNDDPAIVNEIKSTISHLNRQAFAKEFWDLDKDLIRYYKRIPGRSRPTMERVLIYMIESDEKWLQIVGAKTCVGLDYQPAAQVIEHAIQSHKNDDRFRTELESCLKQLNGDLPTPQV